LSSKPSNPRNGKVSGIAGEITAIDAADGTFTIAEPEGAFTCPALEPTHCLYLLITAQYSKVREAFRRSRYVGGCGRRNSG